MNVKDLKGGDKCRVTGGAHKGKSGRINYVKISKAGHQTITVTQENGARFKTISRKVELISEQE